jgi:hypothetical protein
MSNLKTLDAYKIAISSLLPMMLIAKNEATYMLLAERPHLKR